MDWSYQSTWHVYPWLFPSKDVGYKQLSLPILILIWLFYLPFLFPLQPPRTWAFATTFNTASGAATQSTFKIGISTIAFKMKLKLWFPSSILKIKYLIFKYFISNSQVKEKTRNQYLSVVLRYQVMNTDTLSQMCQIVCAGQHETLEDNNQIDFLLLQF